MEGQQAAEMRPEYYRADQNTLVIPVGKRAAFAAAAVADVNGVRRRVVSDRRLLDCLSRQSSDTSAMSGSDASAMSGSEAPDCEAEGTGSLPHRGTDGSIQIICRYDSSQGLARTTSPPPTISCLQSPPAASSSVNIGDFSSIVEIDGDCVIIHSRLDEPASLPTTASSAAATPITERCRRFYQARLRGRRPAPAASDDDTDVDTDGGPASVDSGRESGSDGSVGPDSSLRRQPAAKTATSERSPLELKMAELRREMASLMHQDDDLFRQLLALNDSIESLRQGGEEEDVSSLSPASSLSSLAELAAESCSPTSTLSSNYSRQSHLSSDSGTYALIKSKYRSQPLLSTDLLTAPDSPRPQSSRSFRDATQSSLRLQVSPPPLPQVEPPSPKGFQLPSLSQRVPELRPATSSGHRKQPSCDSGIVEQETRGDITNKAMPSAKVHVSAATDRARNAISAGSVARPRSTEHSLSPGQVTPYSRLMNQLRDDERLLKEMTLGKRVGFYRFYGDLGTGNFSQVKLGVHQLTNERVAVKILNKAKLDQKTQRMLAREIANMDRLHHPHIIRLYEVLETLSKIHLVMEHASGGELFHKITTEGRLPERRARPLVAQLVSAIQHMHDNNLIHRDIKAENVFFAATDVVKLGDLGFSTMVVDPEQHLTTFCGSPPYAAPELFRDDFYTGAAVDIWALGILVYFMVAGAMPFRATTVAALKRQILAGAFPAPEGASESCQQLVRALLRQNPADRLTLAEVSSCSWLAGQQLPAASRPFALSGRWSAGGSHDSLERATRQRLYKLGVDGETLEAHWDRGSRSPVTGLYRITMHRLMRVEAGELVETGSPVKLVDPRPVSSAPAGSPLIAKHDKSKTCVIL